jgi:heme-degrading monooxygenase HmoA
VSVTPHHELAQVNVARLRAPLDTPQLADFVANLEPVNALADAAPGFVWRLQTEDGNATAVRVLDDDMLIVNMSVWRSLEALSAFVYGGGHREVMRRRREWFERLADAHVALWWVEVGTRPTVAEAERRLVQLRTHGPTREAFTFRTPFPAPGAAGPVAAADDWRCPAG